MEKVGNDGTDFVLRLLGKGGMDFDSEESYRDVARLGPCDEGVAELAQLLGWKVITTSIVHFSHEIPSSGRFRFARAIWEKSQEETLSSVIQRGEKGFIEEQCPIDARLRKSESSFCSAVVPLQRRKLNFRAK